MMWYWGGGVHWWGWLLGMLGMVAFWGLVIWGVWYVVTGQGHRPEHDRRPHADARQILDERLARGEIGSEEYLRVRGLIDGEHIRTGDGQPPVGTRV